MLDLNQIQNQNQRGIVLSRGNLALSLFLHLHQNHVKKKANFMFVIYTVLFDLCLSFAFVSYTLQGFRGSKHKNDSFQELLRCLGQFHTISNQSYILSLTHILN